MAINSTTDIHLAIDQLGLNGNIYALDQSVPPHKIIKWDSENKDSQPTDDELNAAYTAWKNANDYQEKRSAEYPPIEDQLDDIYHNGVAGWKTTIKAIKDKYPKP
jgi:predicted transglutaminase-like protease|tara:strand:+ start:513 stop:827 length:315 start_codon:yes stop_codon:yes gene_type:complete